MLFVRPSHIDMPSNTYLTLIPKYVYNVEY